MSLHCLKFKLNELIVGETALRMFIEFCSDVDGFPADDLKDLNSFHTKVKKILNDYITDIKVEE